jgi:2-octaprenyl-3-methyl-6-methoxy-1,4-benzoquinol hydroxylase
MNNGLTIVGAGLVGSSLALALAEAGISVRLIDANPPVPMPAFPDLRVVALNRHSIQWLQKTGIWPSLDQARLGIFETLCIEDKGESLCFDAASQGYSRLGVIAENNHLLSVAQAACLKHPKIQTQFHEKFVYHPEDPRLVIAADGAHSALREAMNIPCFTHDYDQRAWVCYVKLEKPHKNQAWQIFLPSGPLAFLPMPDPHTASIVWTLPQDSDLTLTDDSIAQASQFHFGKINIISSIAHFPLRLQLAGEYFKQNLVFLGDAIHTIHPLAGQGVNLGFADAASLFSLLVKNPPQHWTKPLLLKRYQRDRRWPNTIMAHSMSAINLLFREEQGCWGTARSRLVKTLDGCSGVKRTIEDTLMVFFHRR